MPTDRHPTAQNFHNLVLGYIKGNTDISPYTKQDLADAGILLKDKITLDTLTAFIQAHHATINDWAADTNHGHTELDSILFIPFGSKTKDGWIPIENRQEALEKCRALLDIYDTHILPVLSDKNRRIVLTHLSEDDFTPLMQAIKNGDVELTNKVIDWLECYAKDRIPDQLTLSNKEGFTPLMDAIRTGNTAMVKLVTSALKRTFREKISDPHQDTEGKNPFYNHDIYKEQWRATNNAGFNLLHQAVATLNLDVIDEVIRHLREVNLEISNPKTPAPTDNNSAFLTQFQHRLAAKGTGYSSDPKANSKGTNLYHIWATVAKKAMDDYDQQKSDDSLIKITNAYHTYKHLAQLFERDKTGSVYKNADLSARDKTSYSNMLALYDTNVPPALLAMPDYADSKGIVPSALFKEIEQLIPRSLRKAPHEKEYDARKSER